MTTATTTSELHAAVAQRDPVLSMPTIAARLNVNQSTVREEIRRGHLAAFRVGKLIRVRESELNRYMAGDTTPAAS